MSVRKGGRGRRATGLGAATATMMAPRLVVGLRGGGARPCRVVCAPWLASWPHDASLLAGLALPLASAQP